MRALIDSSNEVNVIYPAYATKLGPHARKIDFGIQKIDGSHLDTFGMVITDYAVKNKLGRVSFFQKTFLLANISLEMVLGIFFFTFSKTNILFVERGLVQRTYTIAEALPITRSIEIIDKREFAAAALNADNKTFVMHVVALAEPITMPIHLSCQAQVAALASNKIGIVAEYSDFSDIFFSDSAMELPEYTRINDHPIDLLDNKEPPYSPIYSLGSVGLEMLKTYIKANLASGFIMPSKSLSGAPILFI